MCDRCAILEEELAAAKAALGEQRRLQDDLRVRSALGLTAGQLRYVMRLYRAKGEFVPMAMLARDMLDAGADIGTVKTQLCKVRRLLGPDSVRSIWGGGYQLSPRIRARIADVLEEAHA